MRVAKIIAISIIITTPILTRGQNTVGIGTTSPNPNAVLELSATNNDQGFLVPRMTKPEREAMAVILTSDNQANEGMIVYDITDGEFYFWQNGAWKEGLASGSNIQNLNSQTVGNEVTINLSGGNATTFSVNDADADPSNEIQDLTLVGNELSITNNAASTPINLSIYLDNTDNQSLTFDEGTGDLQISNGNTVTITDTDDQNEIQDLNLTGNNLTITNNVGATSVDLSGYLDNTDAQTVSINGNKLGISSGNTIDISPSAPSNGEVLKWNGSAWEASSDEVLIGLGMLGTDNYVPKWTTLGTQLAGTSNIYDDGTNVAIGHNSPAYKLDVAGTTFSKGGFITEESEEYYYSSEKKKIIAITPSDFSGSTNPTGNKVLNYYDKTGLFLIVRDNDIQAPVHLPDGAHIMEINIFCQTSGNNAEFYFQEIPFGYSTTANDVASFTSSSTGDETVNLTGIDYVIDNTNNFYRLYFKFNNGAVAAGDGIYNVRITYYIKHAD